jgi:hypothetical protein
MFRKSAMYTIRSNNAGSRCKRDTNVKLLPPKCENSYVGAFVTDVWAEGWPFFIIRF